MIYSVRHTHFIFNLKLKLKCNRSGCGAARIVLTFSFTILEPLDADGLLIHVDAGDAGGVDPAVGSFDVDINPCLHTSENFGYFRIELHFIDLTQNKLALL